VESSADYYFLLPVGIIIEVLCIGVGCIFV